MKALLISSVILAASSVAAQSLEITPAELKERRARVAAAIGPDAMFVALAAPGAEDEYVQDNNFRWLTDFADPESALVLMPGERELREVLFARDREPLREVWTGRIPEHEDVRARTGVDRVISISRFREFLDATLAGRGNFADPAIYRAFRITPTPAVADAFRRGDLELWLLLNDRGAAGRLTPELTLARDLRERFPELRIRNAAPLIHRMREIKSPSELARIRRAVAITTQAQKAGMRRGLSATHEYQIEAEIERVFRENGAERTAFPSIVAAGANATTLHYNTNQDPVPRDALVLTDVGADVQGYKADVTRTWPADGTFSPEQRLVYEAVLHTQDKAIRDMRPGMTFGELHSRTVKWIGEELLRLGLITRNEPEQATLYFIHALGHHLGLATHDVYDAAQKFQAGMVLTAEPGIYVRRTDVTSSATYRNLPAEERAQIDAALDRFADIGVRIEDVVLVTNGAPELVSGTAPRTVEEIEEWMSPR